MRTFTIIFILCVLSFTQNILSQSVNDNMFNPLSDRFALNFEGGATYPRTDFTDDQISYIGQLSFDYYFQSHTIGVFGLRGYGYYGQLKGNGIYGNRSSWPTIHEYYTEIAALGAGVTYTLNLSEVFYPYAFLGADYLYFDPKDKDGNQLPRNARNEYSNITWSIVGEVGSKFFVSNSISLNIAFNYHYLPIDNLDDVDNANGAVYAEDGTTLAAAPEEPMALRLPEEQGEAPSWGIFRQREWRPLPQWVPVSLGLITLLFLGITLLLSGRRP